MTLLQTVHGNVGQVSQGLRPTSYHTLTDTTAYHVLALDYRGFGLSSGTPTERGLIADAEAAVRWAVQTAGVAPGRIVLLGQSLGTAVASAAAEAFARERAADFAGVVLVAGFSSLPTMLSGYAIAGWLPVLRPLAAWPWLLGKLMDRVVDTWDSAGRLRETVRAVKERGGRLRLSLVHAKDDWDIPCHEDDKLFRAAVEGLLGEQGAMEEERFAEEKARRTVVRGKDSFVTTWEDGDVVIRQELFPHGGECCCSPSSLLPVAFVG